MYAWCVELHSKKSSFNIRSASFKTGNLDFRISLLVESYRSLFIGWNFNFSDRLLFNSCNFSTFTSIVKKFTRVLESRKSYDLTDNRQSID